MHLVHPRLSRPEASKEERRTLLAQEPDSVINHLCDARYSKDIETAGVKYDMELMLEPGLFAGREEYISEERALAADKPKRGDRSPQKALIVMHRESLTLCPLPILVSPHTGTNVKIRFSAYPPYGEANILGLRLVRGRTVREHLQIVAAMHGLAVAPAVQYPIQLEMWRDDQKLQADVALSEAMTRGSLNSEFAVVFREII